MIGHHQGPGGARRAAREGADLEQAGVEARAAEAPWRGADVRAGRVGQPQERRRAGHLVPGHQGKVAIQEEFFTPKIGPNIGPKIGPR